MQKKKKDKSIVVIFIAEQSLSLVKIKVLFKYSLIQIQRSIVPTEISIFIIIIV